MSGLEVVIVVGGAIYITKKVRERRERKKLESTAASELEARHGRAAEITPTPTPVSDRNSRSSGPRQQVPVEDAEPLPLYKAPTGPPPSNTTDMRWSASIHLPTYDELSGNQSGKEFAVDGEKRQNSNGLLRVDSSQAISSFSTPLASPLSPSSARTSYLTPPAPIPAPDELPSDTSDKKKKFWRRLSSSKAPVAT